MIVLADLEWIETDKKHLTQLSAVRLDSCMNAVLRFDALARLTVKRRPKRNLVGLGGWPVERFDSATDEFDVVLSFAEWLTDGDEIWVWANSNGLFLRELWERHSVPAPLPPMYTAAKAIRKAARCGSAGNLYAIMTMLGGKPPQPEHRSENDVEALRFLMQRFPQVKYSPQPVHDEPPKQKKPPPPPTLPKPKPPIRQRNADIISRTQYNYIYAEGGTVFHRRDCKLCLGAKTILGSVRYDTAAKNRRPCKVCKPEPMPKTEPAPKPKPKKQPQNQPKPKKPDLPVLTTLLGGARVYMYTSEIVGWCQYSLHPGALKQNVMEEHRCIQKQCRFFLKNDDSRYWRRVEQERRRKENVKAEKRKRKAQEASEAEELENLRDRWQTWADELGCNIYIVRAAKESPNVYRLFFVSDNTFADGNRYPDFTAKLHQENPKRRVILRHIRDMEGRFVTTEEYFRLVKK